MQILARSAFSSIGFQDWAGRFSGRRATSQGVLFPSLILFTFSSSISTRSESIDELIAWISISFASAFLAWTYFTLFGAITHLFAPRVSQKRLWLVVFLFASTEVLRTCFAHWLSDYQGLAQSDQWLFYIIGGAFNGLILMGLTSIALNDIDIYRVTYRKLTKRRNLLDNLIESAELNVARARDQLIHVIQASLNQALDRIFTPEFLGSKRDAEIVDEILQVSDDFVRPISHDLFERPRPVPSDDLPVIPPRVSLALLFENATRRSTFSPVIVLPIFVLLSAPTLLLAKDATSGLLYLLSIIVLIASSHIVGRVIRSLGRVRFVLLRVIIMSGMFFMMGAFTGAIFLLGITYGTDFWAVVIVLAVLGFFIGWFVALTQGLRASRMELLAEIEDANKELEWQQARLQSQAWVEQKSVALVLHNDVQPTLIAGALRFRNEVESGQSRDQSLRRLRDLLSQSLAMVLTEVTTFSLSECIERMKQRWSGVINIAFFIDLETQSAIDADPIILRILEDVLNDTITNSIKYGSAKNVSIRLELMAGSKLSLSSIHDGKGLDSKRKTKGLGSKMLDVTSLNWDLKNVKSGAGVELTATFPLGQ